MYAWFGAAGCQLNQFFISFNLVLVILTSVTSVLPSVQEANAKSGLAQAAMVAIYSTYLVASALSSEPLDKNAIVRCNPIGQQEKTETTSVFLGSLFTFLALVYSTSFAATTFTNDGSSEPLLAASHLNASVEAGGLAASSLNDDGQVQGPPDDEQDGVQYNYSFFHFVFMIGAMYLAMLITNWDSIDTSGEYAVVGKSLVAVWVKVVSR
jgi:serine incorporator 1/3